MLQNRRFRLVIFLLFCAMLFGGLGSIACNVRHEEHTVQDRTPIPERTPIPSFRRIAIAEDFAELCESMLDWNAPYGVDHFSTISYGSSSVNSAGNVIVKGLCYGRDEYGRSVGRYTFDWEISVDEWGVADSVRITFKKD